MQPSMSRSARNIMEITGMRNHQRPACPLTMPSTFQSQRRASLTRTLLATSLVFALMLNFSSLGASDTSFLLGFLAGDYRLVGQRPGSGASYVGRVSFRERDGKFDVIRTIAGASTQTTAVIETSVEGSAVLRSRFTVGGVAYEATYIWHSDLDNYPRLTGYIYRAQGETESPGLEALFHIPPTPDK